MRKKDILELKKRFKKDYCTFSKMCGCYVNGEKNTILKFRETFLNLDEDEYFKYLEIAKKKKRGIKYSTRKNVASVRAKLL